MSRPNLAAVSLILSLGPTSTGRMMPALALSTAPRSDVSSHGCTTMVGAGGTVLAAAISRSYLLGDCVFLVSAAMMSLRFFQSALRRLRLGIEGGNLRSPLRTLHGLNAEQPCDLLQTPGSLARDFSTGGQHFLDNCKGRATLIDIIGQQLRNGRQCRFPIQKQHEELLADQHLELGQRHPRISVLTAHTAQSFKAAL